MSITEAQARRLWALAYAWAEEHDFSKADVHDRVMALCRKYGVTDPGDLERPDYEAVCAAFESDELVQ